MTFRSWQPGIVALRPLPFGDFLTVPFKAMRFNRSAIVGAPLLLFLVNILVTAGAVWLAATDDGVTGFFDGSAGVPFDPRAETVIAAIVAGVLWVLSDTVSSAIVIPAVAQAALGKKLSIGEAMRITLERIWALLGLGLITVLASALVIVLMVLPIILDVSSGGEGLSGIGFMFLLFFVIALPAFVVLSVYMPVARGVIMLERRGPFVALRRAIRLVPGRFWWTVLILLVVGVINGAIQQVFGFGAQMVALALSAAMPDNVTAFAVTLVVAYVIQMLASVLVQYSFMGSSLALVYLDMRFRKEGLAFDMARAAEASHSSRAPSIG